VGVRKDECELPARLVGVGDVDGIPVDADALDDRRHVGCDRRGAAAGGAPGLDARGAPAGCAPRAAVEAVEVAEMSEGWRGDCAAARRATAVNAGAITAERPTSLVLVCRVANSSRISSRCVRQMSTNKGPGSASDEPAYTAASGCARPPRSR